MAYQGRHRLVEIYRGMSKKAKVATVSGILIAGIGGTTLAASATTTASMSVPGSITATTLVTNHPDSGGSGIWATDTYTRTLTVSPAAASVCSGDIHLTTFSAAVDSCYTATVADAGTFVTKAAALTPNQGVSPGSTIGAAVSGNFTGGATYDVYALNTDTLTATTVLTTQDGNPAAGFTTSVWPTTAFSVLGGARAPDAKAAYTSAGVDWSWTYKTACESWTDAGTSGSGQIPGDGNITGLQSCTDTLPATVPTVSNGHVLTVDNNRATVAWTESSTGWPSTNKCEEIWINGPGFGAWNSADPTNPGTAHVGFTCDNGAGINTGYLSGLEAGHLYALRIVPATGTYGSHQPIPGAAVGYVDVFTTR